MKLVTSHYKKKEINLELWNVNAAFFSKWVLKILGGFD